MKILHIDPDDIDNPVSGGGPIRTFEIYRRLAKRHNITVLTPSYDGCKREEIKEGVRYIRVGRKFRHHKSSHFISFFFMVPFFAKKFDYDILVEDLMPPTAATITPLLNRKPIIASVQWFFAEEWARQYKIPFHLYQKWGLKLYKNFIVLTGDMKDKISKYNPLADIITIPEGAEDTLFETAPSYDNFILYLGRIENQQKGVDILLNAFHKIANETNMNLVIAGDGIDFEKMKALAAKLQLAQRITFTGKVGLQEKTDLLSRCNFVCMPSRYETFGMVALEAFASAKPVIAFDIPSLRDVINKDISFIVNPFDMEGYVRAMMTFINNGEYVKQLGHKAREYAMGFKWDKIALCQEKFYEKCLFAKQ